MARLAQKLLRRLVRIAARMALQPAIISGQVEGAAVLQRGRMCTGGNVGAAGVAVGKQAFEKTARRMTRRMELRVVLCCVHATNGICGQ